MNESHDRLTAEAITSGLDTRRIGRRVLVRPEVASTNDLAMQLATGDEPEGTVVVADYQNAGRGRLGRHWLAPAGTALLLSTVLRPTLEQLPAVSMAAGVAVCRAVGAETGLAPMLKWPNDVLVGGRKLSGMLLEVSLVGEAVRFAVLGIGLNVNFDARQYPDIAETATSIQSELGRPFPRLQLLRALLRSFDATYDAVGSGLGDAVWHEWRSLLSTLGQPVRATIGSALEVGIAEDVDRRGQLRLRRADGSAVWLTAGEVTVRPAGSAANVDASDSLR